VVANIVSLGAGWYQCSVTATPTSSAANSQVSFYVSNIGTAAAVSTNYTGNGSAGMLLGRAVFSLPDSNVYGEYFNEVTLSDTFRARNWLESELVLLNSSTLRWQDAAFTWDSEIAATTSWIAAAMESDARADRLISTKMAALPTDLVFGAECNSDLTDVRGATAVNTASVSGAHVLRNGFYSATTVGSGVVWTPTTAFPSTLSFRFTTRMWREGSGDLGALRNTSPAYSMTVQRSSGGVFTLACTDGKNLSLPATFAPGLEDYITFAVVQNGSTRQFAAYCHRSQSYALVSRTDAPAQGTYNRVAIGTYTYTAYPAVIGNVEVYSGPRNAESLAKTGLAPVGYNAFVPMVPGDYEYQQAILATLLSAPPGVGQPALASYALNVDVPDVNEQANFTVASATWDVDGWVTISFSKRFSVPPSVVVFQRGGAGAPATGEVRNITKSGFDARLVNSAGSFVAGNAAYIAVGY
jgi:hypothetical protein